MKTTLLLANLFIAINVFSQAKPESFVLRCHIVNEITEVPIPFAHIYNESRKIGLIADTNGYFATNVMPGDLLAIMALGFLGQKYIVKPTDSLAIRLRLKPRYFEIEEVSVNIPRNYNDFQQAILELDVDKDKPLKELPKQNPYKTPVLLDTNIISKPSFMLMHPVTGLYLKHSKREKSKRKVWHLQQQELRQGLVDEKYNRELVSRLTGLMNYDLINFMGWCNFSFNYLYNASALEIVDAIYAKYEEYIKCCYNEQAIDTIAK